MEKEEEHEALLALILTRLEEPKNIGEPASIEEALDRIEDLRRQKTNAGNPQPSSLTPQLISCFFMTGIEE